MPQARSKLSGFLSKMSWAAFAATIILIPFRLRIPLVSRPTPPIWQDYTDFLLFASDIALLLVVLPWLLRLWLLRQKPSLSPSLITYPLIALTLISALSTFNSLDPALSLYHSVRLVLLFGFYLFVTNEVRSLSQLALPLAIQVGIQSAVAVAQTQLQRSVGLQKLGEYLLDPIWSGVSIVLTESSRFLRAYGLSDHPNILGGCLAFALVLLFIYSVTERKLTVLYAVVFVFGSLALFYTFSRSAWLGLFFGLLICFWLLHKKAGKDVLRRGLILLGLTAMVLSPFVWQQRELLGIRLGTSGEFETNPSELGSIGERGYLITKGSELFEKHPITGVGLGAMPQAFLKEFPNFFVSYQPSHFVILESAAETGLLGATFFLILMVAPWLVFWRMRNMPFTPGLIAAFALLLAISTVGFLDYYPWLLAPGRLWQWLAWGLWARFYVGIPAKA